MPQAFEELTARPFPDDVFKIVPRRLACVADYDELLENFAYKNFVAIRRSVTPP